MLSRNEVRQKFQQLTSKAPSLEVVGRGRVNLIGGHTDYNAGFTLPAAIDRSIFFFIRTNAGSLVRVWALDVDQSSEFDLGHLEPDNMPTWLRYVAGICDQYQKRGFQVPGFDLVFGGDLPLGAGMSSSAALETGLASALNHICQAGLSKPELAQLAVASSHQFVGILCGILDQFASLMGEEGHFILLDCRSLNYDLIPVADQDEYEWLLLNSQVNHELESSEYSVRVKECQEGVRLLQAIFPGIQTLRDLSLAQVENQKHLLPEKIYRRCRYVCGENKRVLAAKDHLVAGRWEKLGQLLLATHAGLRDDYEVSCPEIDFLVEQTAKSDHALGARIMGGGFGGCTINLVKKSKSADFIQEVKEAYQAAYGIEAIVYRFNTADGTRVVS